MFNILRITATTSTNRGTTEQRVVVNGSLSEWKDVTSGVPQGAVLGSLLFTIYINDIDISLHNRILKFADDTKMWRKVENQEEVESMHEVLQKLSRWSEENEM